MGKEKRGFSLIRGLRRSALARFLNSTIQLSKVKYFPCESSRLAGGGEGTGATPSTVIFEVAYLFFFFSFLTRRGASQRFAIIFDRKNNTLLVLRSMHFFLLFFPFFFFWGRLKRDERTKERTNEEKRRKMLPRQSAYFARDFYGCVSRREIWI